MNNTQPLRIGILDGDDIGHEIVPASVEIAAPPPSCTASRSTGSPLPIGARALDTHGHTLPPETLETLKTLDGWILGPIGHRAYPKVPNAINPHPILRKQFNLFANVRPTRSYPGHRLPARRRRPGHRAREQRRLPAGPQHGARARANSGRPTR